MAKKIAIILNYIFFLAQLLIAVGFIAKRQYIFIFSPGTTSLVYVGIVLTEKFSTFRLNNFTRALLIITITSHDFFGEYLNFYTNVTYFDKFLHMFGAFSFALVAFELLSHFINISTSKPKLLTFIIVLLLGISLGTIFELQEFLLDIITKGRNQGGLIDTDVDMFHNLIGSVLAGLFQVRLKPLIRRETENNQIKFKWPH